jgi:phage minor structural protein
MSVIYIYDEHLKVVDISDTNAMETAKIDMSINEASTLDITSTFKFPDEMRYVALRDPIAQRRNHDEDEFLMYRISSSAIEDDGLFSYTFTEFAYDELAYDGYIVEQRPNQSTFNDGLDLILSGTKWKRGLTNIEGTEDLDFFYLTRIEAISELNKKFPAEFRFWLRLKDDGTIEERIVDAVQKRGQNTGKRFETTSNLISLVAEDDFTNVYSAIVPRGRGEEIDADGDPNTRPGYGRKISIKDVEWSKAKGDPLNKPKGQEWLALENGETLVDGRLRYKIVNFDDDTDPNVLINHAYVQLLKDSVVKRQFTANAMDLGVSELGDTVQLVDKERRMEYQARIFHVVYDMVEPTNSEVEFGDNIRSESSISNVISNVAIKQDQILNDTNWAIQQADGKNTTYYGKDEPSVAVREGDIWFREQDNGTTQMYRYEGGNWVSRDSMNPQRILENFYKNGELDAKRINVINLNASNIITGTLDAVKVRIVGKDSNINMADGGIMFKPTVGDAWETDVDRNGMDIKIKDESRTRLGINSITMYDNAAGYYRLGGLKTLKSGGSGENVHTAGVYLSLDEWQTTKNGDKYWNYGGSDFFGGSEIGFTHSTGVDSNGNPVYGALMKWSNALAAGRQEGITKGFNFFDDINFQGHYFLVNGAANKMKLTWVSWSDWGNYHNIALTNENATAGIALNNDNLVLFGAGKRADATGGWKA